MKHRSRSEIIEAILELAMGVGLPKQQLCTKPYCPMIS